MYCDKIAVFKNTTQNYARWGFSMRLLRLYSIFMIIFCLSGPAVADEVPVADEVSEKALQEFQRSYRKEKKQQAKDVRKQEKAEHKAALREEKRARKQERLESKKAKKAARVPKKQKPQVTKVKPPKKTKALAKKKIANEQKQQRKKISQGRQSEWDRQGKQKQKEISQQRAKIKKEMTDGIEPLYQDAVREYKAKNYAMAEEIFLEIDQLMPDYRQTKDYLSRLGSQPELGVSRGRHGIVSDALDSIP